MAIRVLITEGTRADCKEAVNLIQGIYAYALRPGYVKTIAENYK